MRKIPFAITALAIIVTAAAVIGTMITGPKTVDARAGEEFFLTTRVDREIIINLDSNPTTGYTWLEEYDNAFMKLVDAEYKPGATSTGLAGAGGTQTYRFRAIEPGKTRLTLIYKRPWGDKSVEEKVFNITIN